MKKNLLITIIVILILWLIVLSVIMGETKRNNTTKNEINEYNVTGFSTDFTKIVDEDKSSVVSLNQNETYSTGFIYNQMDNKVYIITSFHGVSESEEVNVYFNSGVSVVGRAIGHDSFADVAVIECEFDFDVKPFVIGDSTLLNDGEFVLSIGTSSSLDYDFSTAFGMISSNYREIENNITFDEEDYTYYLGVIQLSGDFTNGYSGAPVINMNGEVVGMITMEDDDRTFAITINEIEKIFNKIINDEEYTRVDFGLKGKYVSNLESYELTGLNIGLEVTSGYYVSDLKVSSFGSNAGVVRGDVIVKINNTEIHDFNDFLDIIYSDEKEFNIEVIRNGEQMTLKGTLYD